MEGKTERKTEHKKSKSGYALIILVSLLLIFSVVQAIEINNLKDDGVSGSSIKTSSPVRTSSPMRTQAAAPSMVGGC